VVKTPEALTEDHGLKLGMQETGYSGFYEPLQIRKDSASKETRSTSSQILSNSPFTIHPVILSCKTALITR
jgi:hypothetical protein